MAVPKFFEFLPVVLRLLLDSNEKAVKQIREEAIVAMGLSEEDCKELLPSGRQRTVDNRINWAVTYLKNAGLITAVRRGVYLITSDGKCAYAEVGDKLDLSYLERYESFRSFHGAPSAVSQKDSLFVDASTEDTPQDMFDKAYSQINNALAEELLAAVMERSPKFFEQMVVDLLLKMGYGRSIDSAGLVVGQSGDEGIDGIIREDKLGFSNIYIQAKRWDPQTMTVGRPEIQKFVGALAGQGASKGLFITTTQFSKEAIHYASKQLAAKIVLVDGHQLTRLMIEYGIGVSVQSTYTIKKIDSDYFDDTIV
ncbi:MAG: restriction endonuclease [Clostridia bacterium]|nr:restriction endonuclease [Clostridia bacterium]